MKIFTNVFRKKKKKKNLFPKLVWHRNLKIGQRFIQKILLLFKILKIPFLFKILQCKSIPLKKSCQEPNKQSSEPEIHLIIYWQSFAFFSVHQSHLQWGHLIWLYTFKYIFSPRKEITFCHHYSRKKLLLVPEEILLREELPIMSLFTYFRHIYLFVKPYRHYASLLLEQSPYNEVWHLHQCFRSVVSSGIKETRVWPAI